LNKSHIISTDEDPGLRIESFAVINLRGVSTSKKYYKWKIVARSVPQRTKMLKNGANHLERKCFQFSEKNTISNRKGKYTTQQGTGNATATSLARVMLSNLFTSSREMKLSVKQKLFSLEANTECI
jgi:hypothetical protein